MKRTITVLLIIAIIIGALIGVGTWLKSEAKIEPVDYDAIMQQEYGEHDLEVIDFFNRVKEYGVYVANCPEGTFLFGEDKEASSVHHTAYNFVFYNFSLDEIINGYIILNLLSNETMKITGGFSENMRNSISYDRNLDIRFQDLSQKAQYEIIQIADEIANIVSPKVSEEYKLSTVFIKNADLLLLGKKEGLVHEMFKDIYLGDAPQEASCNERMDRYYNYYLALNSIIENEGALKRDFEEGKENIAGLIESIKSKIGN